MGRDLRRELKDFDGTHPDSWRPNVGDMLVGTVIRYDRGRTKHGDAPICVIRDEVTDEPRSVWLLHTVLRDEFKEQRPRVGESIGIKRLPDSDKGYKRYVLRVDRPEPDVPDFGAFAAPGDVAPEHRKALRDDPTPLDADDGDPDNDDDDLDNDDDNLPF